MLTIEEVRRITWIRFTRLETRERTERRTCPLPTVSCELAHAPCAIAGGSGMYGLWIPALEIEIAIFMCGRLVPPRALAVPNRRLTICSTVKLLLSRQALTKPL